MSYLYDTQRAMRQKRQNALQRGLVAVLDVGTTKMACMVLQFDARSDGAPRLGMGTTANHGSFRVIGVATTRSRGVRFGEIAAMEETERAIRTVVQGAQKMANVRVDHVIACLAGADPRSYGVAGEIELDSGT
ncbi:MAG: cell division protein FtsA, partial [Amylibacter sp.]